MAHSGYDQELRLTPPLLKAMVLEGIKAEETDKIQRLEKKIITHLEEKQIPLNLVIEWIQRAVGLGLSFSEIYAAIFSINDKETYEKFKLEPNNRFFLNAALLGYQSANRNFQAAFEKCGLASFIKDKQNLTALSICCGTAQELPSLYHLNPTLQYVGIDINEPSIKNGPVLYHCSTNRNLPANFKLIPMDASHLLDHEEASRKKDIIILRHPQLLGPVLSAIKSALSTICHEETEIYLSCYWKHEIIFFSELLNIPLNEDLLTRQAADQDEFSPQPDVFSIRFTAKDCNFSIPNPAEALCAPALFPKTLQIKLEAEVKKYKAQPEEEKIMPAILEAISKKEYGKALRNAALLSSPQVMERLLVFRDKQMKDFKEDFIDFINEHSSKNLTALDLANKNKTAAGSKLRKKLIDKGALTYDSLEKLQPKKMAEKR